MHPCFVWAGFPFFPANTIEGQLRGDHPEHFRGQTHEEHKNGHRRNSNFVGLQHNQFDDRAFRQATSMWPSTSRPDRIQRVAVEVHFLHLHQLKELVGCLCSVSVRYLVFLPTKSFVHKEVDHFAGHAWKEHDS